MAYSNEHLSSMLYHDQVLCSWLDGIANSFLCEPSGSKQKWNEKSVIFFSIQFIEWFCKAPWVPLLPSGEMTSTNVKMPGVCSSSTVLRLLILYGFFDGSLATSPNSAPSRGEPNVEFHAISINSISIWVTLMECNKCGVAVSWSSTP